MDDQRRVALVETKTVDTQNGGIGTPRWRFQLDNHLGSALVELDLAAAVISYEEYHPYGSTAFHVADGNAEVSRKRYRYTGKERDEETGFYYHGARYYVPWLGRWLSADPAGMVDGLNLYRYSRDNPIRYSDPGGTDSEEPGFFSSFANTVGSAVVGFGQAVKETGEAAGDFAYGVINDDPEATIRGGEKLVEVLENFTIEGQVKGVSEAAIGVGYQGARLVDKALEGNTAEAGDAAARLLGNAATVALTVAPAAKGGLGGGVRATEGAAARSTSAAVVRETSAVAPKPVAAASKPVGVPPRAAPAAPKPAPAPKPTPPKPDPTPAPTPETAPPAKPSPTPEQAARRAELNRKFGRSGDLDADINQRGVVDSVRQNALQARDITRAQRATGQVGPSASAFGTRAHSIFERLNLTLAQRVKLLGLEVRAEVFLDATGAQQARRAAGTIGADVVVEGLPAGRRVFDLKTFVNQPRAIGTARQADFVLRFGVRAEEIFVRQ